MRVARIRGSLRGDHLLLLLLLVRLLLLLLLLLLLHRLGRRTLGVEGLATAIGLWALLHVGRRQQHASGSGCTSHFQVVLLRWRRIVGRVLLLLEVMVVRLWLQVHQIRVMHQIGRATVLLHVRWRRVLLHQKIGKRLSQVMMMMVRVLRTSCWRRRRRRRRLIGKHVAHSASVLQIRTQMPTSCVRQGIARLAGIRGGVERNWGPRN